MQDGYRIFGNGKSSKTTNKNQHHKFPSGLGYPKPEGKDEGEPYTLFRTLPMRSRHRGFEGGDGAQTDFGRQEEDAFRSAGKDRCAAKTK